MQMFTLRRLRPAIAWLGNFQRLQRKYMRHSLAIFSTSRTALRVQALLFVRQMATLIPDPAMDQALKVRSSSYPPSSLIWAWSQEDLQVETCFPSAFICCGTRTMC